MPIFSKHEAVDRTLSSLCIELFRADLDKLLENRRASLWLSWTGKWLKLSIEVGNQVHVAYSRSKKHGLRGVIMPEEHEEVRGALLKLMKIHGAVIDLDWHKSPLDIRKGKLFFYFKDANEKHGGNFIEVPDGRTERYRSRAEDDATNACCDA